MPCCGWPHAGWGVGEESGQDSAVLEVVAGNGAKTEVILWAENVPNQGRSVRGSEEPRAVVDVGAVVALRVRRRTPCGRKVRVLLGVMFSGIAVGSRIRGFFPFVVKLWAAPVGANSVLKPLTRLLVVPGDGSQG